MGNLKILKINNLIDNLNIIKSIYPNICAVVKANAYGHGEKQIVTSLKNEINWFATANAKEAIGVKKLTKSNVLVLGKSNEYLRLINNQIHITVDSIKDINKICSEYTRCKSNFVFIHIAINTGMNRLGTKTVQDFKNILIEIEKHKFIKLCGIYTHCFDADCKYSHFYSQMKIFYEYVKLVKNKNILIHIGGSFCLKHKIPNFINMVRVGYFLYGYGHKKLKKVMQIESEVIKVCKCNKGEYISYGHALIKSSMNVAIIQMGYADGVPRNFGDGKGCVYINNKKFNIIGKICMDMLIVDIKTQSVKVGDKVIVLKTANELARKVKTSPYEILTNFGKSRTKYLIKR